MRLSCDPKDPGYANFNPLKPVKIQLDGVPQFGVITADDQLGLITRYVRDENGRMKVNADGSQFETETVRGKVVIERRMLPR